MGPQRDLNKAMLANPFFSEVRIVSHCAYCLGEDRLSFISRRFLMEEWHRVSPRSLECRADPINQYYAEGVADSNTRIHITQANIAAKNRPVKRLKSLLGVLDCTACPLSNKSLHLGERVHHQKSVSGPIHPIRTWWGAINVRGTNLEKGRCAFRKKHPCIASRQGSPKYCL